MNCPNDSSYILDKNWLLREITWEIELTFQYSFNVVYVGFYLVNLNMFCTQAAQMAVPGKCSQLFHFAVFGCRKVELSPPAAIQVGDLCECMPSQG